MIVEIIPDGGIGRCAPLKIPAAQVVVRQDNGTPIFVAAKWGPDRADAYSTVGMKDFAQICRAIGLDITEVDVQTLRLPGGPPAGARLVAGPS